VIVTLGDEPLITPEVIARFVDERAPARATYDGRPGHPVALGPRELAAVVTLAGDRGARDLLSSARAGGVPLTCAPDAMSTTPRDLEAIRSEARPVL